MFDSIACRSAEQAKNWIVKNPHFSLFDCKPCMKHMRNMAATLPVCACWWELLIDIWVNPYQMNSSLVTAAVVKFEKGENLAAHEGLSKLEQALQFCKSSRQRAYACTAYNWATINATDLMNKKHVRNVCVRCSENCLGCFRHSEHSKRRKETNDNK